VYGSDIQSLQYDASKCSLKIQLSARTTGILSPQHPQSVTKKKEKTSREEIACGIEKYSGCIV